MAFIHAMKNYALACVFLAVVVAAVPSNDLVPEAHVQLHKEASKDIASLIEAGKPKDACTTLADSTISETKNGVATSQKVLNRLDFGKNCHTSGLAAYNSAKKRESNDKKKVSDAQKALSKAKNHKFQICPF